MGTDLLSSEVFSFLILPRGAAEGLTLAKVGERLGVSAERVRQIQNKAFRKYMYFRKHAPTEEWWNQLNTAAQEDLLARGETRDGKRAKVFMENNYSDNTLEESVFPTHLFVPADEETEKVFKHLGIDLLPVRLYGEVPGEMPFTYRNLDSGEMYYGRIKPAPPPPSS